MEINLLKELDELRIEQGIEKEDFEEILGYAILFQNQENISQDELRDIVLDTLSRLDSNIYSQEQDYLDKSKTNREAFDETLRVLGYKNQK